MKIVFFTGAGISAESGIQTFRDANGLWENYKVTEICDITTWRKNKDAVFKFYSERRQKLAEVEPNEIHKGIAEIQNALGVENVSVITQNIDNLLERAGCKNVMHVHGFLPQMKCMNPKCNHVWSVGYEPTTPDLVCPVCQGESKPNVVFFGEDAPMYYFMKREFYTADSFFVVMGTMGNVVPVARYLDFIEGKKILNNLEPSLYLPNHMFDYTFYEKGTTAIEKIKKIILGD